MKVVAMVSGGKDSCYNMMQCVAEGHEIVALANLHPKDKDELDSYMYQTVGHMGIEKLAEAMDLPLYRMETKGLSRQIGKQYVPTDDDEVEDLYNLLKWTKEDLNVEAVAVGAILSDYQRVRVENVCNRLNLVSLAYLWRRDQSELLQEMIDCQMHAIIIKVASLGLVPDRHLGKSLKDIQSHLLKMKDKYGVNVCGEGGEYETFTLNCPLFKQEIVVDDMQTVISSLDPICPVGYINFTKLRLVPKEKLVQINVKTSSDYLSDLHETSYDDLNNSNTNEVKYEHFEVECENVTVKVPIECEQKSKLVNEIKCLTNTTGWVWVSGIQGNGQTIRDGMIDAMEKFNEIISKHSLNVSNICHVTLYIRSMNEFATINEIYVKTFNIANPPTRVCVECPMADDLQVIMDVVGFAKNQINETEFNRSTMHVQGISHWAPANIGPYSQSTKINQITFISGQIALIPGSMKIIDGNIGPQCKLALRHIMRIAKAMNVKGELRDVVQGICFVTDSRNLSEARRQWENRTTNAIVDYVVVPALPRQALVEWQVWMHAHNDKFDYEETGCSIANYTVFSVRRWNFDCNCAAIVCHMSISNSKDHNDILNYQNLSHVHIKQLLKYTVHKLFSSNQLNVDNDAPINTVPTVYLKIFYESNRMASLVNLLTDSIKEFCQDVENIVELAWTVIPVCRLYNSNTFLSICGARHE